jgi:hypothetical protein
MEEVKDLIGMQLIPKDKLMDAIRKSTVGGPQKPEKIEAVYEEPKPEPKRRGRKPKEKPEEQKIDTGKIMALYRAKWSEEAIADEMKMEPDEVVRIISEELSNGEL